MTLSDKPYFSTSTMESYDTLDEAIHASISWNMEHDVSHSEIVYNNKEGELVRGKLSRVGELAIAANLNHKGSSRI